MSRHLNPVVLTFLMLGSVLSTSGCFPQRSTITQKASTGYLKFTGANPAAAVAWSFQTRRPGEEISRPLRIKKGELYSLNSGPWTIRVTKGDQPVIEKEVIVSSEESIEIALP